MLSRQSQHLGLVGGKLRGVTMQQNSNLVEVRLTGVFFWSSEKLNKKQWSGSWPAALNSNRPSSPPRALTHPPTLTHSSPFPPILNNSSSSSASSPRGLPSWQKQWLSCRKDRHWFLCEKFKWADIFSPFFSLVRRVFLSCECMCAPLCFCHWRLLLFCHFCVVFSRQRSMWCFN